MASLILCIVNIIPMTINFADAFLYFYYPGDEVREDGGGVIVRLNEQ